MLAWQVKVALQLFSPSTSLQSLCAGREPLERFYLPHIQKNALVSPLLATHFSKKASFSASPFCSASLPVALVVAGPITIPHVHRASAIGEIGALKAAPGCAKAVPDTRPDASHT